MSDTCKHGNWLPECIHCEHELLVAAEMRVLELGERLSAAQARNDDLTILNQDLVIYRDQQEERLAAAEALLSTACDAWECGQMVWNQEGVLLSDYKAAMLPRAWYEAAKGGRDGKGTDSDDAM